ncbi:hypothetical protein ACTMTF_10400 [Nonomuraea sp. ZG12]|uniref:hypothetical protein n=1 Tax=Nonomuraea sp. ZG12 TaxID=3452207 RepID=UPI003F888D01
MTDNSHPQSYGPPSEPGHSPGETPQGQPPPYGPPQQYVQQQYGQAPPFDQQGRPPQGQPFDPRAQPPQYPQAPPPQYGQQPPFAQYGKQPQFGQQYQPGSGPGVDPKTLRPQLRWIGVSWGVAALCIAAGVILFVSGLLSSVDNVAPTRTFAAGERVTVALDPAQSPVLYLTSRTRVRYECQIANRAKLLPVSGVQTLTVNGTKWQQILRIDAPSAGDYQVTCTVTEGASARFGVGRDMSSAVGGVLGGVVLLVAIPGVGILAAIIVTIVVLMRRSSQRKRLAVSA